MRIFTEMLEDEALAEMGCQAIGLSMKRYREMRLKLGEDFEPDPRVPPDPLFFLARLKILCFPRCADDEVWLVNLDGGFVSVAGVFKDSPEGFAAVRKSEEMIKTVIEKLAPPGGWDDYLRGIIRDAGPPGEAGARLLHVTFSAGEAEDWLGENAARPMSPTEDFLNLIVAARLYTSRVWESVTDERYFSAMLLIVKKVLEDLPLARKEDGHDGEEENLDKTAEA